MTTADRLGISPLTAEFARIEAIADPAQLVDHSGYQTTLSLPSPVTGYVDQDALVFCRRVAGIRDLRCRIGPGAAGGC